LENEISNKTRECPNFFPLGGGKWILFFAPEHMAEYRIGRFEHECFIEEEHGILDYGGWHGFYAPHGTVDEAGSLVLFGWMPETGRPDYSYTEASLCQLSVPRVIGCNPGSGLRIKPAPEVENLFGDLTVPKGLAEIGPDAVDLFESDSFYLKLRISDQSPFRIILSLFVSENSRTEIVFDSHASIITILRGISTDDSEVCRTPLNMPLHAVSGVGYEIALYVDRTSVEIFSAEKDCLSGRIFPPRDSLMQVRIESAHTIGIDTLEYAIAKTPESIRYAEAVSNDCAQ
jgi:beta-fructofuranosidase